jgi:Domain of unknown function (DUF1932)
MGSAIGAALAGAVPKSGRYVAEMREIAATQAAAGPTSELFDAMADVFAALSASEGARRTNVGS